MEADLYGQRTWCTAVAECPEKCHHLTNEEVKCQPHFQTPCRDKPTPHPALRPLTLTYTTRGCKAVTKGVFWVLKHPRNYLQFF